MISINIDDLEAGQRVFLETGCGDVEGVVTETGLDEVFVQTSVGLFDLQRWDIDAAYLVEEPEPHVSASKAADSLRRMMTRMKEGDTDG